MDHNEKGDESIDQLPKKLIEPIKSIIKSIGYTSCEVKCKNLSTDGGTFIGILYEIDIKGTTADGHKETNIFVKNQVENAELKIYSIPECFVRESFIYKELSVIFEELQDEANVPDEDKFKVARHYNECNADSIILENLTKRGFKVYQRMDVVSLKYAEMSIKHLAKFHSLSFVIQKKRPDYFEEKIKIMKQPFVFGDEWEGLVKNMSTFSINCLENGVKEKIGELILKKVDDYEKYMGDTSGVLTLCHGDYKHNNIMAKDDGKLTEVLAIDYQLLHYGKPILDFLYFIFNGTDQEFRRKHLTDLKNLYYDSMKRFLQCFQIEIESVFPREEFESEFKEKLDFGLMINAFYVPFLFVAENDAPDVVNRSLDNMAFNVDKRFTERFRGVVDFFY